MTTRGGAEGTRPEGALMGGTEGGEINPGLTMGRVGAPSGAVRAVPGTGGGVKFFCGKSGVVLAAGGEPVKGGAAGRGCGRDTEGGRDTLGIGFVTAVDQAGGTFCTGAGVIFGLVLIGSVVAAEMLGRLAVWAVSGLSGRGGKLIRSVWRLGAFGSALPGPWGLAESAIFNAFYSYFGKYSMAKLVIVTSFLLLSYRGTAGWVKCPFP